MSTTTPATDIDSLIQDLQQLGRFQVISKIGDGGFGSVVLALDKSQNLQVAVKLLPLGPKFQRKFVERELLNHRVLNHPHNVQFREVLLLQHCLAIVMEYVGGGNLHKFVKEHGPLPETLARWFFQQLVIALDYSHRKLGIANRDLKLENALIDNSFNTPILKICDFGYSKDYVKSSAKSIVGTPAYLAPEILQHAQYGSTYDGEKADVWSCGIMLFCMLSKRFPVGVQLPHGQQHNMFAVVESVRKLSQETIDRAISQGLPKDVPPMCRDMLSQILKVEPTQRINLQGIMQHQWFRTYLPDVSSIKELPPVSTQCEQDIYQILDAAETAIGKLAPGGGPISLDGQGLLDDSFTLPDISMRSR